MKAINYVNELPVESGIQLVMFTMPTCGPCKMMKPALKMVSESMSDLHLYEIDSDESPDAAEEYEVRATPTILYFKNGSLVDRSIGFETIPQIKARLERL